MREIIMTASASIKTPQMTLPILADVNDEQADAFCKSVARVVMSEFVDKVVVTETTSQDVDGSNSRSYVIGLKFYTKEEYETEYDISQEQLEDVITSKFLHALEGQIVKEVKKQKKPDYMPTVGKSAGKTDMETVSGKIKEIDNDDDDEDNEVDEDHDEEQAKQNVKQQVSYEGPDDDEIETMKKLKKQVMKKWMVTILLVLMIQIWIVITKKMPMPMLIWINHLNQNYHVLLKIVNLKL